MQFQYDEFIKSETDNFKLLMLNFLKKILRC